TLRGPSNGESYCACLYRQSRGRSNKKLTEAARQWALGGESDNGSVHDDLKAMGAPAELIEELGNDEPEVFEVMEENWEAFTLFRRMSTQWVYTFGAAVGLNYQSLDFLMKTF